MKFTLKSAQNLLGMLVSKILPEMRENVTLHTLKIFKKIKIVKLSQAFFPRKLNHRTCWIETVVFALFRVVIATVSLETLVPGDALVAAFCSLLPSNDAFSSTLCVMSPGC